MVKTKDLAEFLKEHVFIRFGVPETLTVDQAPVCNGPEIRDMAEQYGFKLINSTPYYAQANRDAIDCTPYELVYGHKAILSLEMSVRTIRVDRQSHMTLEAYQEAMSIMNLYVEAKRAQALSSLIRQKKLTVESYNKRVREKSFKSGDLV
ncbi:hypothetical protein RND81_14G092400 [Saponaria officinalis]|uniref:Integrase catalytic domain-containing protein n=1 Tax=Saponaria officinalis TaxID=3572 RepID=A0AAW1GQE1_SAPOF